MKQKSWQAFSPTGYLADQNTAYVEDLYESYLKDPTSVSAEWKKYFDEVSAGASEVSHQAIRETFQANAHAPKTASISVSDQQESVDQLIDAYRNFGHTAAQLDPLGLAKIEKDPRLTLEFYRLSSNDLSKTFLTRGVLPKAQAMLQEIQTALEKIYCGFVTVEYGYVTNREEYDWIKEYCEKTLCNDACTTEERIRILEKLTAVETLEQVLGNRYVAQTRFSGEGCDSFLPCLDEIIEKSARNNIREILMGMAHRARLNVQVNILGYPPQSIFDSFEGKKYETEIAGDVKYHLGAEADVQTVHGPMHLSLVCNPSHLEFVDPVLVGSARARQDLHPEKSQDYALAVMIHGDAAFSGQGIVMETFSMAQARGYTVGGALHIILNNQLGFTTSDARDARSSRYCSDLSKMIEAPVIHVNGDHPEAVVIAARMMLAYRQRFHKDIVMDLVGYRRYGHNEGDEPSATQPIMYKKIRELKTVRAQFAEYLEKLGVSSAEQAHSMIEKYRARLEKGDSLVKLEKNSLGEEYEKSWDRFVGKNSSIAAATGYDLKKLQLLGKFIATAPENFKVQKQVNNILHARALMANGEQPLDWGCAENLAYASLLEEGRLIRFTGEDVRRGTFAHRHTTLFDQETGKEYCALKHLPNSKGKFEIYDSILSEQGVLGFEYGYSISSPDALVIWEAQYGDFVNTAQVIIDQFIACAWQKWRQLSGLVMLLPHGFQGQGPEHSSARLERFLQLAAQDNIQVCMPSTPAQMFHLLRRQVIRPHRTPLVVFTPKSLLRNKLVVSSLNDLAKGEYQLMIPEIDALKAVDRVVLCAGKMYYDVLAKRRELKKENVALVRMEQFYPFPETALKEILKTYASVKDIVWAQEEPHNQGAWMFIRDSITSCLSKDQVLRYAGRPAAAVTATGYSVVHVKEQEALVNSVLL